jgi:hypothetical protein
MSHWLTERCGLLPAPAGLALVQDLLNTRKIGPRGTDLLATPPDSTVPDTTVLAQTWLPDVVAAWAADTGRPPEVSDWAGTLSQRELVGLRGVRTDVLRLMAGKPSPGAGEPGGSEPGGSEPGGDQPRAGQLGGGPLGTTELQVSATGELRLEPIGTGWRRLAAAIWLEVFLAQQNGDWNRLKLCRNPVCGSAFFDRSKNNSGVWHDVKVCGNAANLRASRARKRLAATSFAASGGA